MAEAIEDTLQEKPLADSKRSSALTILKRNVDLAQAFSNLSHELRTPLAVVLGSAELLEQQVAGKLNADQLEMTREILSHSDRLLVVIEQILDWSKIMEGKLRPQMSRLEFSELVDQVISTFKKDESKARVEFQSNCEKPLCCRADRKFLEKSILSLMNNALKFSHEEQIVRIKLSSSPQSNEVSSKLFLRVEDQGIGIDSEFHEKIFEPFFQVESGATRSYGGVGLGLSLARFFIRIQGGEIRVTSRKGKGSVFEVVFPQEG